MDQRRTKKRIVFLIGSMRRGGAERVISILANDYADRGWQVEILMLLDSCCDYALNNSIKVRTLYNQAEPRIRQLPKWIFCIRKYIMAYQPDRIVSFIARINIITILACWGLRQHIVVSERNDPSSDGRSIFVRMATYLLYPVVDSIVFQTKWAQSHFPQKIQRKSIIIQNPVNVTVRANLHKKKKIVAVGRLDEQKNHTMLINAFKKIHADYPEYQLFIYGEGGTREKLSQQICDLSLSEAVFLPGNEKDIHAEIADAEIFVLSSNYEGLSNALIEAMMMGLACISTAWAGSDEVILNMQNGLLVPVGSENSLTEAIDLLVRDRKLALRLGQHAQLSTARFNSADVLKSWRSVID